MPFQINRDPVERPCCVPICSNKRFNLTHKFPCNKPRCDQWLAALHVSKLYMMPRQKLIRNLNTTAVPSLNINELTDLHLVASRWKSENEVEQRLTITMHEIAKDSFESHADDVEFVESENIDNFSEEKQQDNDGEPIYLEIETESNNEPVLSPIGNKNRNLAERLEQDLLASKKRKTISDELIDDDIEGQLISLGEGNEYVDEVKTVSAEDSNDDDLLCLSHPDYTEPIEVDLFWLRDHCKCNLCYNYDTFQRRINILDIPTDIKPLATGFKNKSLYVKWNDEHESEYELEFLFKSQKKDENVDNLMEYIAWDTKKIENSKQHTYASIDFTTFLSDESSAVRVLSSIVQFGFAFIKNVPATTDMTEMTIKRLFPIQKTLFGEMWTFTNNKAKADTAYTTEYLGPHTDNTYFCDAAGLQVFHCIKYSGTGGTSFFVDGFNAIEELQLIDPTAFDILTRVDVPAEYIDKDQHHKYSAPIIQLDRVTCKPKQIRFNLYDRCDFTGIDVKLVKPFYQSLKTFAAIIDDDKNIFKFMLEPGTVVIFDNWRVLHGRDAFEGERVMTGCYVAKTDFMSKARVCGLVK